MKGSRFLRRLMMALLLLPALLSVSPAQLSKADLSAANEMASGTLYLRISMPCRYEYYRWGWGRYQLENLAEVTPKGSVLEPVDEALPGTLTEKGVIWWFLPNDAVRLGKVRNRSSS